MVKETGIFVGVWTAIYLIGLLVWTWWTISYRGVDTSISKTMEWVGHQWPIVPAAIAAITFLILGVLFTHWWWNESSRWHEKPPSREDRRLSEYP